MTLWSLNLKYGREGALELCKSCDKGVFWLGAWCPLLLFLKTGCIGYFIPAVESWKSFNLAAKLIYLKLLDFVCNGSLPPCKIPFQAESPRLS